MIRRIAALLLVLACLAGLAAAEELLPHDYTNLTDKLYRQLLLGSGLRGIARFNFEGGAEWAEPFVPLSGALIQFRTCTDEAGHTELLSFISKNDTDTCNLRLWGDGESLYLSTPLLEGGPVRYPWRGDFYSSLTAQGEENPNYLSAIVNALIHADDWTTVTAPLRREVESWLMSFTGAPETITDNGRSIVCVRYRISAQAVKNELKTLLRIALNDEDLRRQIQLYLSEDQRALGFSVENLAYEDRVIDTLPLEGEIGIERRITTMGEVVSTVISFPLVPGAQGWTSLEVVESGGELQLELAGGDRPLALSFTRTDRGRGNTVWQGTVDAVTEDGRHLCAAWSADRSFTESVDEDYVTHEVTVFNLRAEPAAGNEVDFEPIALHASLFLYSGYAQTSGVTIEIDASADILGEHVTLTAKLLSVRQYDVNDMDVTGAVDAVGMPEAERSAIPATIIANCLATLAALDAPPADGTESAPGEDEAPDEAESLPGEDEAPDGPEETPGETPEPDDTEEPSLPVLEEIIEDIDLDEEEQS